MTKHLSVALMGSALALTGCLGSGSKKIERDPNGVIRPQLVEVGTFRKSPRADVIGDTRDLEGAKKIVLPFFMVQFNKKAGESASASTGGPLGSGPSAHVHVKAKLAGVDEATMKRVTNAAYTDLVAQFKAAGFDVVDFNAVKATATYQKLDDDDYPKIKDKYSVYMADGMRNPGKFTFGKTWGKLMNDTQAHLISVNYTMDFATFGTDINSGMKEASAAIDLGQVAHVWGGISGSTKKKCKRGSCWGDMFNASLGQATYSGMQMGTFADTTSGAVKGTQAVMNVFAGLAGTSTRSDSEKTLTADPKKYEAAALEALKKANTRIVAKVKAADKS